MPIRRFIPMVLWAVLVCCGVTPSLTATEQSGSKPSQADKAGQPAPIEEVQEVAPVESPSDSTTSRLLGRLHPALVHFPIAWVFLLLIVEITALSIGREEWSRAGFFILILASLSFIPAVATGFLRADLMKNDLEFRALMVPHRNLNIAAGIICLAALALRASLRKRFAGKVRGLYLLLLACCAVLLFIAGHLGGKMVFGADYLPF